ncbi:MAG: class I SAM-dependent methyltransferase [Roseiflexaceae bacterium]
MNDTPTLEPVAAYALWADAYPPNAHNPLMRAEERAMLALLPGDLSGARVLDAGCGSGRYLLHARQRGAGQLLGVDLSAEMLARVASSELEVLSAEIPAAHNSKLSTQNSKLIRASLDAIPIRGGWADITICGLTLGHLEDLRAPLAELRRVIRPGGSVLCSDFHPIGHSLGWRREFNTAGRRYAVRHTWHSISDWRRAADALGLEVVRMLEPRLDPADIPAGASYDSAALEVPVALVFELLRV